MLSPRCNVIPVANTSNTTSWTIRDVIGKYSSVFSDTLRSMLRWLTYAKGEPSAVNDTTLASVLRTN